MNPRHGRSSSLRPSSMDCSSSWLPALLRRAAYQLHAPLDACCVYCQTFFFDRCRLTWFGLPQSLLHCVFPGALYASGLTGLSGWGGGHALVTTVLATCRTLSRWLTPKQHRPATTTLLCMCMCLVIFFWEGGGVCTARALQ
jgi:hypothetical protein